MNVILTGKFGREYELTPSGDEWNTKIKLIETGQFIVVESSIKRLVASWKAWEEGQVIQEAFSYLDSEEREFILTGITQDEWDAMMRDLESD